MKQPRVLLSGPTIAKDEELASALQKYAAVSRNIDNRDLTRIVAQQEFDLLLLELTADAHDEVAMIKAVSSLLPKLGIIVINGDGDSDVIAAALQSGARDAFRMPYRRELVVERVGVMLGRCS